MTTREQLDRLCLDMVAHERGNAHRVQHFIKVSAFCALIARGEGLDEHAQFLLEATGCVHDIGIRIALEQLSYQNGKLQEQFGPGAARLLLEKNGFAPEDVERICWLVGHHHTMTDVTSLDHRILLEADALVNLHEGKADEQTVRAWLEAHFRTAFGSRLCREMLLGEAAE